jgi:hypothetical protein
MADVASGGRTMTSDPSPWWRSWARRSWARRPDEPTADADAEDADAEATMPAEPAADVAEDATADPRCPACGRAMLSVGSDAVCEDWRCSGNPISGAALRAKLAAARHHGPPPGYRHPEQQPTLAARQVGPIRRSTAR